MRKYEVLTTVQTQYGVVSKVETDVVRIGLLCGRTAVELDNLPCEVTKIICDRSVEQSKLIRNMISSGIFSRLLTTRNDVELKSEVRC